MSRMLLYLDTNVWMHFPVLDQDWNELVGGEVTLFISAQVFKELNHFKDNHLQRNMRDRLRRLLSKVEEITGDGKEAILESGVGLQVNVRFPPKTRYADFDLDADESDHKILLDALLKKEDGIEVAIVSGDKPLRLLARQHELKVYEPLGPRFEDPQTETDKELAELRRQVMRLPKLEIRIAGRQAGSPITLFIPEPRIGKYQEIQQLIMLELDTRPEYTVNPTGGIGMLGKSILPAGQIHQFDHDWNTHLKKFKKWAEACYEIRERYSRSAPIASIVANTGTAAADDVHITFEVDDPYEFAIEDSLELPDRPEPPEIPRGPLDVPRIVPSYTPSPRYESRPSLEWTFGASTRSVECEIPRIIHNRPIVIPEVRVVLPQPSQPQVITVNCTIRSSSVAAELRSRLVFDCQPVAAEEEPGLLEDLLGEYELVD